MLEYLEAFRVQPKANTLTSYFTGRSTSSQTLLQAFSSPNDSLGYADKSISDEMITEVFIDFTTRTRQRESAAYLKTLSGMKFVIISSSFDSP
jgi:hypothetical protein